MSRTYDAIESQTLTATAASVTFSAIPGNYTDLVVACSVISTGAASSAGGTLRFNSDTGTNYSHSILYGTGSAAGSIRGATVNRMRVFGDIPTTGNQIALISIMSYASASIFKTVLVQYGSAISGDSVGAVVGLWRSTSAITSVSFFSNDDGADSFAAGSTFQLFGVRAES